MLEHGHAEARKYPLGMLSDEVALVVERLNGAEVTRATLLRLAVSSVISKEAGRLFTKQINKLNFETFAQEERTGKEGLDEDGEERR